MAAMSDARDQAMALLFDRSGWTQEELAKKEGKGQPWVNYRLRFGRFLNFITMVINSDFTPNNLTERKFRLSYKSVTHSLVGSFPMAKHKTVTHLPASYPPVPWPPTPAPRVAASLFVVVGELLAVGLCIVDAVTVAGWLASGSGLRPRAATRPASQETTWLCRVDRWTGEQHCWPTYRSPPVQRYYARDGI